MVAYFLAHRDIALLALIFGLAPLGSGAIFLWNVLTIKTVIVAMDGVDYPSDADLEKLQRQLFQLDQDETFNISIALTQNLWDSVEIFDWDYFNEIEAPFDYPESRYLRPNLPGTDTARFEVLLSPKCHDSYRISIGERCTDMFLYFGPDKFGDWCREPEWIAGSSDYFGRIIEIACSGSDPASILLRLPLSGRNQPDWYSAKRNFFLEGQGKLREQQVGPGGNVLEIVWADG